MPEGLYVRDDGDVTLGAIVTVRARDVAPLQAAQRNLVGDRDRFIKRVAAVGGDEVCGDGERLSVNGGPVARRNTDAGVALGWRGCRVLSEGEVLLLGETDDSFDGRYWGPTRVELIEGVWRVL